MSELPEGWAECTFSDIGELHCGQSPASSDVNRARIGVPYVSGPEQWDGETLHLNKWTKAAKRLAPPRSIFITVKGAGAGTIFPGTACAIGRDVYAFEPHEMVDRGFAKLALSQIVGEMRHAVNGLIPGLSKNDILPHRLRLPPLAEQSRIVAKVEALLALVRRSSAAVQVVRNTLKKTRQRVIDTACGQQIDKSHGGGDSADTFFREIRRQIRSLKTPRQRSSEFEPTDDTPQLPETWTRASISQVARLDVGFAFKSQDFVSSGIRLLRGENIEPGRLRWTDTRYWPVDRIEDYRDLLVEEGEVILALDRPIVSKGLKIARAAKSDLPCLLVQRVMRFKTSDNLVADFLFYLLQSSRFINSIGDAMTGSDLPHITGTGVASFAFGLPPRPQLQRMISRLEMSLAMLSRVSERATRVAALADKTEQSILAKAFSGELVPTEAELARRQGRSYEPASVLLERIRADRASAPAAPKRRRATTTSASRGARSPRR